MNYHFDFSFLAGSTGALIDGLKVTVVLAVAANAMGLVLGFVLCLLAMSRWTTPSRASRSTRMRLEKRAPESRLISP